MDVNRASHLFQEASQEEIAALFHAALGEGDIRSSRLLSGGLFNTTYYVEYGPEHRRAVLRLGPVNRHLLLGHVPGGGGPLFTNPGLGCLPATHCQRLDDCRVHPLGCYGGSEAAGG